MTRMSFFLLSFWLITACTVNEPELPEWDTQWSIVLKGDSIRLADLVDDPSIASQYDAAVGDSLFFIQFSDTSDVQTVKAQDLSAKLDDQAFTETLGVFEVGQPAAQNTPPQTFSEIFADYNPTVGSVFPPLPPRTLYPDPRQMDFSEFEELDIASATLSIVFYNNLFLDIDKGMTVTLIDRQRKNDPDGGVIDSLVFVDAIPADSVGRSLPVDLAGKVISNQMELLYKIPLVGTDSARVLTQSDLDGSIYTEVQMSPLRVNRALAKVPAQTIIRANTAPVGADGFIIRSARVDKGGFNISLNNKMNVGGEFTVTLPDFQNANGDPLTATGTLEAQRGSTVRLNLAGYTLQNSQAPGDNLDSLRYSLRLVTASADNAVWLDAGDSLSVQVQADSIYFASFSGVMEPIEIAIDPIIKEDLLKVSNLEGNFTFPDVVLSVNIHNQLDLETSLNLNITGYHHENNVLTDSVAISINRDLLRGENSFTTETLTFDKSSTVPSIVDLMSILPDKIKITGKATIGGEGTLNKGDAFYVDYSLDTPLSLQIDNPVTFVEAPKVLSEETLSREQRDQINENFTELSLTLDTRNAFPIGAEVQFYLGQDSSSLFDASADSLSRAVISAQLTPGVTNDAGYVQSATEQQLSFKLDRNTLSLLQQGRLYYGARVLLTTDGAVARFKGNDRIWFTPTLNFTVKMKR